MLSDKPSAIIQSNEVQLVSTEIDPKCPQGTYGRISPRSNIAIKHDINVFAGIIDPDYTGKIIVVLFNC